MPPQLRVLMRSGAWSVVLVCAACAEAPDGPEPEDVWEFDASSQLEAGPLDARVDGSPAAGDGAWPDAGAQGADMDAALGADADPLDASEDDASPSSPEAALDASAPQLDASAPDASQPDASEPDASVPDASSPDASEPDASEPDASVPDASVPDASVPDASLPDASQPDASAPDAAVCVVDNCTNVCTIAAPFQCCKADNTCGCTWFLPCL